MKSPNGKSVAIHWFRQDLRLSDNPALIEAAKAGAVLPVYILDDVNAGEWKMGGASRFWLHHSLTRLNEALEGKLHIMKGDAAALIPDLAQKTGAVGVYWNRCYEPWRVRRDAIIKQTLTDRGIGAHSFNGSLLWEPWEVLKEDKTPYKVFTPFFRKGCLSKAPPREPLPRPALAFAESLNALSIDALSLLPRPPEPRWDKQLEPHWTIGEDGAMAALQHFLKSGLNNYKVGRDFMAEKNTSRLSPHLHFGEISPSQAWYAASHAGDAEGWSKDTDHFRSELGWREFSYSLLYHYPELTRKNMQPKFDNFPWENNEQHLRAWQKGRTGYPIVDAAMRELWQTGYMHNRSRMITGSFLVKHLLINWHEGEDWFWDCLCDADLASNTASWQWVAGSGADAAPYFRIFNPILQGEKFDPQGHYVRRFVPELAQLPDKYLHRPWEAPELVLRAAGVTLGETYPRPIVDHAAARDRALAAFAGLSA
jgi:deoxyribodipyrimidine photo-lyase